MHRKTLNKAAKCRPCTNIGKNLKTVIPASKWKPNKNCSKPNEQIQTDFSGQIKIEKDQDSKFLECIDCLSKHPTKELFDKNNGPNVVKLLDDYIQSHGIARNIRLGQSGFFIGIKIKNSSKQ